MKIAASFDNVDLYQITPAQPYTAADLNYNTGCRANRERDDPNPRPVISGSADADTVTAWVDGLNLA